MNAIPPYLPPEPEPVQSKQDEFDLAEMPLGQSDLNYRPVVALPANQSVLTVRDMLLVCFAAFPCGFLFRDLIGTYLFHLQIFLGVLGFAFLLGLVQTLRAPGRPGEGSIEGAMLAWFFIPVFIWATIALASYARTWSGALIYFLLLPIPLTLFIADQLATHAVWWMSANPRLDLATMLAWRGDWSKRFLSPPSRPPLHKNLPPEVRDLHDHVTRAKRNYRLGLPLLSACVLGGLLFALFFPRAQRAFEHGFAFFLGFLLLLVVICFLRTSHFPGAFGRFWFFFMSWVSAEDDPTLPPWSFHSPSIPTGQRLRLVLACLFLWALALALVTDHFAWFCFLDPNPNLRPKLAESLAKDRTFVFLSVLPENSFAFTYIGVAILACVIFPAMIFILVLFLVTGPTLAAHFLALETPDAYEQR